jgi:phosphotransferase system enzyme I (PtsI)
VLLKGIPASRGIIIATAYVLGSGDLGVKRLKLPSQSVERELARLREAVGRTREQLVDLKRKVANEIGQKQSEIFNAHILFLEDPTFVVETQEQIRKERVNAEWAVWQFAERYARLMEEAQGDATLNERVGDIRDVGKRLVQNLQGGAMATLGHFERKVVLVAQELSPSETAQMDLGKVAGFATDRGGPTSHTAIIARTLELPAVVGLEHATTHVKTGDMLVLDGAGGTLIVNPDKETLAHYRLRQKEESQKELALRRLRRLPAITTDGFKMQLAGNIDVPEEAKMAVERGAEGVGLFRTEFLFLNRPNLPTEEEQFQAYRMALRACDPHPVVIRTLDLGGDKFLAHLGASSEMNPFLGLRAIRLCLAHPYIFKVQLRAILRASHYGPVKIMYPLISGLEELRQANQILEEVKKDLAKRGIPHAADIPVGAMIEVPSAAITADLLAKEVSFFSIGTNDLIQYTMAVDRGNERIAYLYDPLHPALLRTIKHVVDEARKQKVTVTVCGEMGGNPLFALILMGLGVDGLSMSAASLPLVKKIVRLSSHKDAESLARQAMKLSTAAEIRAALSQSELGRLAESA